MHCLLRSGATNTGDDARISVRLRIGMPDLLPTSPVMHWSNCTTYNSRAMARQAGSSNILLPAGCSTMKCLCLFSCSCAISPHSFPNLML